MKKKNRIWFILFFFIAILFSLQNNKSINRYIQSVHHRTYTVASNQSDQTQNSINEKDLTETQKQILKKIQQEAKKKYIAPINARVDRVWKGIPGYNGLEVDIPKTMMLSKNLKPNEEIPYVYKQVPPKIHLNQLEAQPIYRGNPNKPMVAFMINVAWGNEYIPRILKILNQEHIHATFFFDGSWLKKNIPLAREIKMAGNELANHAYSHKNMSQLSSTQARMEIMKTQELLKTKLQVNNDLFAPPSGDYNQSTVKTAHQLGLKTILWTIDTVDWRKPSPSWIIERVKARLHPGALILMHPTASSSEALKGMIQAIRQRQLKIGTVSQVLSPNRILRVESTFNF